MKKKNKTLINKTKQPIVKNSKTVNTASKSQPKYTFEKNSFLKQNFKVDLEETEKSKDVVYLKSVIQKLQEPLFEYGVEDAKKEIVFYEKRNKDEKKHKENFFFNRKITKNEEKQFEKVYFERDVCNAMDFYLNQQNKIVELEKQKLSASKIEKNLPTANLPSVPVVTGGLNHSTSEVIPIVNCSALIRESAPPEGSPEWNILRAKKSGFTNYRSKRKYILK